MSIAVMNWVWANSPTSGDERLALADSCSRDDGTGCLPSAATIGRKDLSDRTVPRVIAGLRPTGMWSSTAEWLRHRRRINEAKPMLISALESFRWR